MEHLSEVLGHLPAIHQQAIRWFAERAGEYHPWPQPLELDSGPVLLASKAKGIYKPKWSQYALSVRQAIKGQYPDRDPVVRDDGTWSYAYFQENENPEARDKEYTNRGLIACLRDRVPVGVVRQVPGRRRTQYHVLGIALVAGWDAGYFFLEGFSPESTCRGPGPATEIDVLTKPEAPEAFNPANVIDGRERIVASIVRRRGQCAFRRKLLDQYNGRCALTGCRVSEVLDAAHITPYRGIETNQLGNGLLLRSDIHVLLDLGLISIHPETRQVVTASSLRGTIYGDLKGQQLAEPRDQSFRPSTAALREHLKWSQLDR